MEESSSKYGSVPKNTEAKANSSEPIAPGQKLSPPMTRIVRDGGGSESSMKPRD